MNDTGTGPVLADTQSQGIGIGTEKVGLVHH